MSHTDNAISPLEAIANARFSMTGGEFRSYLKSNVQKHLDKHQDKSGLENLHTAELYLDRLILEEME